MTDRETTAAAIEIARRLRARNPGDDPDIFASEIMVMLKARGWRPTEARVLPAWRRPPGHGTEPTGDYLAARQALDARLACREPGDGAA